MPKLHPVTIAHLIAQKKLIWGYCKACGRERDILPQALPLPRSYAVREIGRRMKCSACGAKSVETKPELYSGGVAKMRQRPRAT